jgi:hypothetical protein
MKRNECPVCSRYSCFIDGCFAAGSEYGATAAQNMIHPCDHAQALGVLEQRIQRLQHTLKVIGYCGAALVADVLVRAVIMHRWSGLLAVVLLVPSIRMIRGKLP